MTLKHRIETSSAPPPLPVFSQGVRKGPILSVSGQGGVDPATGTYPSLTDVGAQTTRTLLNVAAILEAGGATFDDVVMLRIYLTDRDHFPAMNAAYTDFMTADRVPSGVLPARTTVFVGLPFTEMLVEIDALAVLAG
jgi:2-iminobutanoate/2-iminopropanoate deaminase